MTGLPTIAQDAPYTWTIDIASILGQSVVSTLKTPAQGVPYVWSIPADQNGNYLPLPWYNVLGYGADPTGVTDSSTAIANARTAANAAGGGLVLYPPGTYLTGNLPIYNNVIDMGVGIGITTIRLKNGANTDLFSALTSSINLTAAFGTGSNTSRVKWGIVNLTLDGNQANQSAGTSYCIRVYGRSYLLENLECINGRSGGILCDYNGTPNPAGIGTAAKWNNVEVHDNTGMGIEIGGPSDTHWYCVNSYHNTHSYHICPNASGTQTSSCHGWGPQLAGNYVVWLVEGQIVATNCEAEGSDTAQVVLLNDRCVWSGGRIFAATQPGLGLQIGQTAGNTPYPGMINQAAGVTTAVGVQGYIIMSLIDDITNAAGGVWFANDFGGLMFIMGSQTSGVYYSGTITNTSTVFINGKGITPDGSSGKSGIQQFVSSAFLGFVIANGTNNKVVVDTFDGVFGLHNGTPAYLYSDGGTTVKMALNPTGNGEVKVGNSSSLFSGTGVPGAGLGANGDYYFRNDGGVATHIYFKSAGAWAGII